MRTKLDKIFDNTFYEIEKDGKNINFKIDLVEDDDVENRIYDDILIKRIDELIRTSEFNKLNNISKDGKVSKLSKTQMNLIYTYITKNINDHSKIDIFAAITDYFDVQPGKFYNSLSNIHKEELILELDKKLNILEKKRIRKLF